MLCLSFVVIRCCFFRALFILPAGYKSMDISAIVEDDEEEFLKGSSQGLITLKREDFDNYEHGISIFDDDEPEYERYRVHGIEPPASHGGGITKDSCFPAEPMKKDSAFSVGRQSPLSPTFYPLDQLDWEVGIIWDNSPAISENCKFSGPDLKASVDSEVEPENGPQNLQSESHGEANTKTHEIFLHGSPVILEHFGSRASSEPSSPPFSESRYHPQLLRLESRSEVDNTNQDDSITEKVLEKKLHRTDAITNFNKLVSQNKEMLDGSWLDQIIWEQDRSIRKPKLIFDLQDEQMLFEILDNKDGKNLRLHAGAMVITRSVKSSNGDSHELPGHGGQSGWRSVSNDKHYSNRKTSQQMKSNSKKRTAQGVKIFHSQPSVTLQTMKLKLSK